jgi:hypothetical protein
MRTYAHPTRRRGARVGALLVALASLLALVPFAGASPANAGVPPVGYYSTSPRAGSTISTDAESNISVGAVLSLAPLLPGDDPVIDWGDGTEEDVDVVCHMVDGSMRGPSECSYTLGAWSIPAGYYAVSASHHYARPGTYTARLSYQSLRLPLKGYAASWTVKAVGQPVPFFVTEDPSLDLKVSPAPVRDDGPGHIYDGRFFRQYWYYPGTKVTVNAGEANAVPTQWISWGCTQMCAGGARSVFETSTPIPGTDGQPSITVDVAEADYYTYRPENGVRAVYVQSTTPNLLTNGGFEQPALSANSWGIYSSIDGWNSSRGIEIDNFSDASGGKQYAEIDGDESSNMWQAVDVTPGKSYRLSFDYSPRAGLDGSDNNIYVLGSSGPDSLVRDWISADGTHNGANVWQSFSRTFTATHAQATVLISDLGYSNGSGMRIDNVRLTPVG